MEGFARHTEEAAADIRDVAAPVQGPDGVIGTVAYNGTNVIASSPNCARLAVGSIRDTSDALVSDRITGLRLRADPLRESRTQ